MRISRLARGKAKALFRLCQSNGLLDASRVQQAVARVLEIRPRGYLAILTHFERLVELEEMRRSACIESAVPLPPQVQSSIQATLQHRYGAGLSFRFVQKPELLAGVRVQVGSDVYENSVQARLGELREEFDAA
jgi:F-type H+-transporting ATPase subunit delta